jgi:hypothetical protein
MPVLPSSLDLVGVCPWGPDPIEFIVEISRARVGAMAGDESGDFGRRLEAVERAVAEIQGRLAKAGEPDNWLERVIGSISDVEAFEEALRYGREFRHSDRPADDDGETQ